MYKSPYNTYINNVICAGTLVILATRGYSPPNDEVNILCWLPLKVDGIPPPKEVGSKVQEEFPKEPTRLPLQDVQLLNHILEEELTQLPLHYGR